MALLPQEIQELLRLIGQTRDGEIDCEQCLSLVSEFVEQELAGKSVPEGLQAVEHHLSICAECREEYELLRQTLEEMSADNDG